MKPPIKSKHSKERMNMTKKIILITKRRNKLANGFKRILQNRKI